MNASIEIVRTGIWINAVIMDIATKRDMRMIQNDPKPKENAYLGRIYRISGQICSFQERLDMTPKIPVLHDYMMVRDSDGMMMLKCRSCGFVNFCWKDIFKGNHGFYDM